MARRRERNARRRGGQLTSKAVGAGAGGCEANEGTAEKPDLCDERAVTRIDWDGKPYFFCAFHGAQWREWERTEQGKSKVAAAIVASEQSQQAAMLAARRRRETEERLGIR